MCCAVLMSSTGQEDLLTCNFSGTYTAVPSSLIGALQRNLGIIVKELAKDKDIDLRQNFNCWVSKPLPEESPFRRLVCFERYGMKLMA